jgi:hypothetical protein
MKIRSILTITLTFFICRSYAQSVSPLQQVMTTTSLISRPEVFRDLQTNIDSELGKVKPGLQIEGMHEAIGSIRDKLLDILNTNNINININAAADPINISINIGKWNKNIILPSLATRQKIIQDIKTNVQEELRAEIDKILDPVGKPKLKAAFTDAAASMLAQSEIAIGIDLSTAADKQGTEKLSSIITEIIFSNVQQKIDNLLSTTGKSWNPNIINTVCQQELQNIISQVHSMLIAAFNHAEYQLSCAIDETSKKLIAANTGIGITKGKGSFNGGLYVAISAKKRFQLGVYINGELGKSDSTQPNESLTGLHLRYAFDAVQFDLLGAGLFGDGHFKAFKIAEAGLGITLRTQDDLLVGFAAFGIGETLKSAQFSLGITVQSTQVGAPSVFMGLQGVSGDYHPVIQTSFPIVPSLD